MSTTGSSSSQRHLLTAIDTVDSCLSDPNCEIDHSHLVKLSHSFREFKYQFDSIHRQQYNSSSDMTKDEDSIAKVKMSELMSIICLDTTSSHLPNNSASEPSDEVLKKAYSCFFLKGGEGAAAVVNKKELVYWWIGQGLIKDDAEDVDKAAEDILNKLVGGHIEQLTCSKRRKKMCKYRVNQVSVDQHRQLNSNNRVGMLKTQERGLLGLVYSNGETIEEESIAEEGIERLYNRDVSILNMKLVHMLRKMRKSLKVLQLGRWCSDEAEKHIEADNVEFVLKYLKKLKEVRLISLRGISRIMELGDEICSLGNNLRVLDLQACPNLERLPKGIGRLKNLTHLDLSECYLLDRIPKGIISLTKLQVLDGFVIGDVITSSSCKFKDLATHLGTNLRKLSIRTRKATFPEKDDLKVFSKFVKLLRLKIVWVQISNTDYDDDDEEEEEKEKSSQNEALQDQAAANTNNRNEDARGFLQHLRQSFQSGEGPNAADYLTLPPRLLKLEVRAIPQSMVETWLWCNHNKLDTLRKLSVIGGKLIDLNNQGIVKWNTIETLQLKYLANLHMTWREFKVAFPNVKYLYKTRCPNLSFFQCDENGVWRKP